MKLAPPSLMFGGDASAYRLAADADRREHAACRDALGITARRLAPRNVIHPAARDLSEEGV
jgi:hypothetical protein